MRKRIWEKSVVALALSAALVGQSFAPISAQAEGINDESIVLESEIPEADTTDSLSDGDNTEGLEVSEGTTENTEVSESESAESAQSSDENAEAAEANSSDENTESADSNASSENSDDAQNAESTESSEDASDSNENAAVEGDTSSENTEETENIAKEDAEAAENPEEAVSDGNAEEKEAAPSVSDGDAKESTTGAFDYEEHISGYTIKLHAEEGIIPEGTEVSIKKVTKVAGQKVDDLVNDALPAESAVYDSASFDITLLKDGQEFEPEGVVSVEITLDEELSNANSESDSTTVQVFHIEDDATTTEIPADVVDNATDVYSDTEETVVSYDAESFSVYDVAVVLNFETSDAVAEVNPVYKNRIDVSQSELDNLASTLDSTVHVKSLLASNGKCTSVQEMAEVARNAIKARQNVVTMDFMLPGLLGVSTLINAMYPIIWEHTGVPNEGDYVRWAFIEISRQGTIAYAGDVTYGTLQLSFTFTHDAAQEIATTNKINEIINTYNLNSGSDYDKIKKTYEYITKNISYDHDCARNSTLYGNHIGYSCYSAAVTKHTVCEGYALLFYRIMLTLGIDSRLISGLAYAYESDSGHGWNIVQLGDLYYYLDATWDAYDPRPGYNTPAKKVHFLRGSRKDTSIGFDFDQEEHIRYDECNTPDFLRIYPVSATDYTSTPSFVKPDSVAISQASATIGVGGFLQLSATCLPANAAQGVRWNSSDTTVASVSDSGFVAGLKNGECEIFATSIYGGKKAKCRVLVTDGQVKMLNIATNKITVFAGSKAQINCTVFPEWADIRTVSFKSSKKSVATVNKSGVITGKKPGKCTITCSVSGGTAAKKITVVVKKAKRVKKVKLNKKKLKLSVGQTYRLKAKIKPKKATNKSVTWKSSKPGVVAVDANGNLVALSKGTAKITVKTVDGKKKATCKVKVK
ncbi:Ig-like domain-containing protein [Butyrivibrio sp. VCD2006]|uniref:Ig-like domain-containing protein n=1 Tax=Butyrivibrio sp. VCD2006 TaxID=1280664 RepID=UPI00041B3A86|nr:Ig-like domain-containing protein [Butyrivibrio sp. VCD2006]